MAGSAKKSSSQNTKNLEVDVSDVDFGKGVTADLKSRMARRLSDAAVAYQHERFTEADKLTAEIENLTPGVLEVLEIRGLAMYRLGKWRNAITLLTEVEDRSNDIAHHAVIADCHRAMGNHKIATELWQETRTAGVGPELIEEARVVQAGVLKDKGQITEAIELLEAASKPKGNPSVFVLRRLYVLADLYETAGDIARARSAWSKILKSDRNFGDAAERLADLS